MQIKIPFTNMSLSLNATSPVARSVLTKNGDMVFGMIKEYGVRIAPTDLWKIYRMNADVFSCIREWRQGVGDGGYALVNPLDEGDDVDSKALDYITNIFKNSGGFDKIKNLVLRDVGISGNSFFEIVKNANGNREVHHLKRLDPRSMYVVSDIHGQVLYYVQRVHGANPVIFDVSDIWHIVFDDDPDNELLGMSPLETAIWEARSDISAAQSNYYFFENDAVPSNLYILNENLSEDEKKEALKAINTNFSNPKNRHKSAVLDGIKEVKTLSITQKDMEFVIGRKFNTDKICSVYGVAKYILGYTESVNYSNGEGILKKFYQSTLQPLENNFSASINNQLFEKLGVVNSLKLKFLPQTFGDEIALRQAALEEMKSGAITLRQYKIKTGQAVLPEDEAEPLIDKHIIQNGASAVLLEDVGVDPVINPNDQTTANNIIQALKTTSLYEEKNN